MSTEEALFSFSFFRQATVAVMLGIPMDAGGNECHVTDDRLIVRVA